MSKRQRGAKREEPGSGRVGLWREGDRLGLSGARLSRDVELLMLTLGSPRQARICRHPCWRPEEQLDAFNENFSQVPTQAGRALRCGNTAPGIVALLLPEGRRRKTQAALPGAGSTATETSAGLLPPAGNFGNLLA